MILNGLMFKIFGNNSPHEAEGYGGIITYEGKNYGVLVRGIHAKDRAKIIWVPYQFVLTYPFGQEINPGDPGFETLKDLWEYSQSDITEIIEE